MKSFLIFLLVIIFFFLTYGGEPSAGRIAANRERVGIIRELHQTSLKNAVIDIQGTIIDSSGKKLDNVNLQARYSRPKDIWETKNETVYEESKVGPFFHCKKRHYTSVVLTFQKDGYYDEELHFYFPAGMKQNAKINPLQKDLIIKLRKIGKIAKTKKLYTGMSWRQGSPGDYIDLTLMKKVSNATVPGKNSLSIDVERDKFGNILKKQNTNNIFIPKVAFLQLKSEDKSAGFIVDTQIKNFGDMKKAPLNGYHSRSISLEVGTNNSDYLYFYFYTGKYYGKGRVEKSVFPNISGDELRLVINLYFNLEQASSEKRNVTTADYDKI